MGHPQLENKTTFAFEPAFLTDEEGRPVFVPIVKATYTIKGHRQLDVSEEQVAANLAGEYWGDPDTSSYKYEPECVFIKLATDCVLIGHARAPGSPVKELDVGFRVGPVNKVVRVFGDRFWVKTLGTVSMTNPIPFEQIPLLYELAYGGWDRAQSTPEIAQLEPRNPVGTGFRVKWNDDEEAVRLPNIEDPKKLIRDLTDRPAPAGFGFTSPNWQPRAALAGTYDDVWMQDQMPLLPLDFDRRFFNAASPGLVTPGYLKGDEIVTVVNASDRQRIDFNLPGVAPPRVHVELRGRKNEVLETNLDTVIVNTDENLVILIWRAYLAIREVPHDVVSVVVESDDFPAPATVK